MEKVYVGKKNCFGCSACFNICPTEAITMERDEEGFLYLAYIDFVAKRSPYPPDVYLLDSLDAQKLIEWSCKHFFEDFQTTANDLVEFRKLQIKGLRHCIAHQWLPSDFKVVASQLSP